MTETMDASSINAVGSSAIGRRRSDRIVGSSQLTRDSVDQATAAARSNDPVVISGPNGSGRGHIGRAIHAWSRRAGSPFTTFSASVTPEESQHRELFGAGPSTAATAVPQPGAQATACNKGAAGSAGSLKATTTASAPADSAATSPKREAACRLSITTARQPSSRASNKSSAPPRLGRQPNSTASACLCNAAAAAPASKRPSNKRPASKYVPAAATTAAPAAAAKIASDAAEAAVTPIRVREVMSSKNRVG